MRSIWILYHLPLYRQHNKVSLLAKKSTFQIINRILSKKRDFVITNPATAMLIILLSNKKTHRYCLGRYLIGLKKERKTKKKRRISKKQMNKIAKKIITKMTQTLRYFHGMIRTIATTMNMKYSQEQGKKR